MDFKDAQYLSELDAAVKSAEKGLGYNGDQIFAWMRSWGQPNELPSPQLDLPTREGPDSREGAQLSGDSRNMKKAVIPNTRVAQRNK